MSQKTRERVFALLVLAAILFIGFSFLESQKTDVPAKESEEVLNLTIGTVVSIDEQADTIMIGASTTVPTHMVKIDPETQIIKSYADMDDSTEVTVAEEINISDLSIGEEVTISHTSTGSDVLTGVTEIYVGEEELDRPDQINSSSFMTQGLVISYDETLRVLKYEIYPPTVLSTTTLPFFVAADLPIFKVSDSNRFDILHARTPAAVADIKPGQTVAIFINSGADDSSRKPTALIISE